nr:DUF4438 domain-containing protein [[Eubacterium] tenue]
MVKTNKGKVVKWSAQGKIHHPLASSYRVTYEGKSVILPSTGGISYNVKVGDCVYGLAGDHIEPGVSIRNEEIRESNALMTFSCIGNEVKVVRETLKAPRDMLQECMEV